MRLIGALCFFLCLNGGVLVFGHGGEQGRISHESRVEAENVLKDEESVIMNNTGDISVLIVDGFSNHNWQATTSGLRSLLGRSGEFRVDVSTCPVRGDNVEAWLQWSPRFEDYDVVIQTCNDIFQDGVGWPDGVKERFEAYVKRGGGVFMFHSANNAFADWEAYNEMIGLGWRSKDFGVALYVDDAGEVVEVAKGEGEDTGHGPRIDALVTRRGNHPVHEGLPRQWMAADLEVYFYARGPAKNLEVLSYAREPKTEMNFPIEWVVSYGEGRVYNSTYGHLWHDQEWPEGMRCRAFQEILRRALYWLSGNEVPSEVSEGFPSADEVLLEEL